MNEILKNVYLGGTVDAGHLKMEGNVDFVPVDARCIIDRHNTSKQNLEGCRMLASVIHMIVISGKKALVFCGGGSERSALVVAYYWSVVESWPDFDEIFETMKDKRECVRNCQSWIGK